MSLTDDTSPPTPAETVPPAPRRSTSDKWIFGLAFGLLAAAAATVPARSVLPEGVVDNVVVALKISGAALLVGTVAFWGIAGRMQRVRIMDSARSRLAVWVLRVSVPVAVASLVALVVLPLSQLDSRLVAGTALAALAGITGSMWSTRC